MGAQVKPSYFVKIEEHLYVRGRSAEEKSEPVRPDVCVNGKVPISVGMPVVEVEERVRYLTICDQAKAIVTRIELLCPIQKEPKSHRAEYRADVQGLLTKTRTNFVEIDLLRAFPKMPWTRLPPCDYYAIVSRYADRAGTEPQAAVWPVGIRDPLPTIPIPLCEGEPEVLLDLQATLHRIYDVGSYELFIYSTAPEPPLSAADAVWAAQILSPPAPPAS